MFRKTSAIVVILFIANCAFARPAHAAIENLRLFEYEPMAQGENKMFEGPRDLLSCTDGLRQFFAAAVGYQGFTDYWRDIWIGIKRPMQYADIANTEMQLNKARYALVAAFLRCDTDRLKSTTNAYYRLEAELYFLRHFVEGSGNGLQDKTAEASRKAFADEMTEYFVLRKKSGNPDQDRAFFSGYFDVFAEKYAGRVMAYAGYGDDPVWQQLSDKIEEIQKLGKDMKELGGEFQGLAGDTRELGQAALQVGKNAWDTMSSLTSLKGIKETALKLLGRVQVCPVGEACTGLNELAVAAAAAVSKFMQDEPTGKTEEKIENAIVKNMTAPKKSGARVTYKDFSDAVKQAKQLINEGPERTDMTARYELLYGQASGIGVRDMILKMDELILMLGEGSLPLISTIGECADYVEENVCK